MSNHLVITIGRELGSGGRDIGRLLADDLGIGFYDSELLAEAAKESGLAKEIFRENDEKPTSSFLYSLVMDTYSGGGYGGFGSLPLNHRVFLAQFDAIKKIAERESCVIVGRCADYALEEYDSCVSVFIHANEEFRIARISESYDLTPAKARDEIIKTDKKRASYYNYYTSKQWGEASGYDLCLDSSKLGIEKTAELIKAYIKLRGL